MSKDCHYWENKSKEISDAKKFKELKDFHSKLEYDNLFKHNLKQNELGRFGGINNNWIMFKIIGCMPWCIQKSCDDRYYALGLLFAGRGDNEKANEYWRKIKDKNMLKTLWTDIP